VTPFRLRAVRLGGPLLLGGLIALAGCGKRGPAADPPPPPTVTVVHPLLHKVQAYHEYNGYLEAVETVQIRARVKGILTDVMFTDGADVVQDAKLYTIDPREYDSAVKRAKADITRAEADIDKAVADIAGAEVQYRSAAATVARLKRIGVAASGDELDKAEAVAAAALANRKVAEASKKIAEANRTSGNASKDNAELQVGYTKISAPIAGHISRTLVTKGNLVGQTDATLLTTIVRMDKLFVYFDAPERDLVERLRAAREETGPSTVPVALGIATETGYPHEGVIDFRENRVDSGTGTIRVRGLFDNPVGPDAKTRLLVPGMFAHVQVPDGPKRTLVVIPEEALMTGQEGSFVYVVGEGNKVTKKTVTVLSGPPVWRQSMDAPDQAEWKMTPPKANTPPAPLRSVVAIEKGLDVKDVIIVVGLQKARPGAPVNPEEWAFRAPPK